MVVILQVPNLPASAAGTMEAPGTNVRAKSGLNEAIRSGSTPQRVAVGIAVLEVGGKPGTYHGIARPVRNRPRESSETGDRPQIRLSGATATSAILPMSSFGGNRRRTTVIAIGDRSASPACEPSAWGPADRRVVFVPSAIVALNCRAAGCRCGMTSVAPWRRRTVAPGTRTGSSCATGFRRRMNRVRYGDGLPHCPRSQVPGRGALDWSCPSLACRKRWNGCDARSAPSWISAASTT